MNGDVTLEPNETVRLRLGPPSDASVILGTPGGHVPYHYSTTTRPRRARPAPRPTSPQYVESQMRQHQGVGNLQPHLGAHAAGRQARGAVRQRRHHAHHHAHAGRHHCPRRRLRYCQHRRDRRRRGCPDGHSEQRGLLQWRRRHCLV
ncbi:MAG: hypothetical protein WKG07_24555 [Hymenobacter sp.]